MDSPFVQTWTTSDSSITRPITKSNSGGYTLGDPYPRVFLSTHITWVLTGNRLPIRGAQATKCGKTSAQGCGAPLPKQNLDGTLTTKGYGSSAPLVQERSRHGPSPPIPDIGSRPSRSNPGSASRLTYRVEITLTAMLSGLSIQYFRREITSAS